MAVSLPWADYSDVYKKNKKQREENKVVFLFCCFLKKGERLHRVHVYVSRFWLCNHLTFIFLLTSSKTFHSWDLLSKAGEERKKQALLEDI